MVSPPPPYTAEPTHPTPDTMSPATMFSPTSGPESAATTMSPGAVGTLDRTSPGLSSAVVGTSSPAGTPPPPATPRR